MSLERFISIQVKKWSVSMFKAKQAVLVSIGVIIIIMLANTNVLVLYGYEHYENGTMVQMICYSEESIPETGKLYNNIRIRL